MPPRLSDKTPRIEGSSGFRTLQTGHALVDPPPAAHAAALRKFAQESAWRNAERASIARGHRG
jgi:hypothetical protein